MIEAGFEAKGALLKLSKLLKAQSHIIKDLDSNHLVTPTLRDIHHIQNTMCFLKEKQSSLKLFSSDKCQSTFIQF